MTQFCSERQGWALLPRILSMWGNACSRGLRPWKDSQQRTQVRTRTPIPLRKPSPNSLPFSECLSYFTWPCSWTQHEEESVSTWKWVRILLHTIHIFFLDSHWPELGSERVGSLQRAEGSLPATLAMKKHNTGQQLLKIQPSKGGIASSHTKYLACGFSGSRFFFHGTSADFSQVPTLTSRHRWGKGTQLGLRNCAPRMECSSPRVLGNWCTTSEGFGKLQYEAESKDNTIAHPHFRNCWAGKDNFNMKIIWMGCHKRSPRAPKGSGRAGETA